ncbi:hypothetical protein ACWKSP_31145 [Micromonosporaceae bacterium Da 78-11]
MTRHRPTTPAYAAARRERTGWYFHDRADSAFRTTVITVFLRPFLTSANAGEDAENGVWSL